MMMNKPARQIFFLALFSTIWPTLAAPASADETLTFEQHIRPIFKAYCLDCHGASETVKGKLDLRLRRFLLRGGRHGAAIVPGAAAKSLLLERLKAGEMPPGDAKLPAEHLAVLERWINAGAPTLREEPETLPPGIPITPEERAYWFFQPLHRPEPPAASAADRVRTSIDAFVLAKLREKGLAFNPDADKLTLLRRASLDLLGLPPTQQDIDTFLADTSDQAYEKMLDRLLASPHYGERWARHWLDVAGYADSEGDGTKDTPRPYAWKYRDYVIRAFQADKPLNQFIIEQLAGDELVPRPWNNLTKEQIELLTATGFLRQAPNSGTGAAEAQQLVADSLKIIGSSLLGLTVGCAQCHDHRYDPIPHTDYFRLRAIFEPAFDPAHPRSAAQRRVSLYTDADRAKAAAIEAEAARIQTEYNEKQKQYLRAAFESELAKFPADQRDKLKAAFDAPANKRSAEQKQLVTANPKLNITPGVLYQYDQNAADTLKKLQERIQAKRAEKPVEDFVAVLSEVPGQLPVTKLFHRGDYRQPKEAILPGDLTIAAPVGQRHDIPADDPNLPTSGRRLAYAKHLTSGQHPLVGRVLVNRIWLHHFGRGLVDSPGDFGVLGQRPTHPELLDWLATELPRAGWSLKHLHKLIMTSTVYRQSSQRDLQDKADVRTTLYGRYPVRRLDAETLRDRMLATSGKLDRSQFGPPIPVSEDAVGQVITPDDRPRRSIYLQVRRTQPVAFLATFDAPTGELSCDKRISSTAAPQALMLMNSDFVLHQAGHFAQRLRTETSADYARSQAADLIAQYARPADTWQYGFGFYDAAAKRLAGFTPLPHWTGSAWQGGAKLPDPQRGWVIVHAHGGHAGNDPQHASVRRWTAPAAGTLTITGKLKHPSPNGDGVRGRIVSSRSGLLGEWAVKTQEMATDIKTVEVKAGDTLDFAVDCRGDVNSDSFEWPVQLTITGSTPGTWHSAADFHGPGTVRAALPQQIAQAWQLAYQRPATRAELELACRFVQQQIQQLRASGHADAELAALTNLCQQLLSSNEFLYVD